VLSQRIFGGRMLTPILDQERNGFMVVKIACAIDCTYDL